MIHTAAAMHCDLCADGLCIVQHLMHIVSDNITDHSFARMAQQANGNIAGGGNAK